MDIRLHVPAVPHAVSIAVAIVPRSPEGDGQSGLLQHDVTAVAEVDHRSLLRQRPDLEVIAGHADQYPAFDGQRLTA